MSKLNERLIELRNKNNLLQKDVAAATDLSVVGYQRYEYGTRKPTSDVIVKLCNLFNISADYLLGLSDDPIKH